LGSMQGDEDVLRDPLKGFSQHTPGERAGARIEPPTEIREPLATLGLSWPLTMDALKTRYKELAKRHHPDANNGDREAEERLKTINVAYAALRGRLATLPAAG
jgi:DnaJ-domain-containing protein 1